MHQAQPKEGHKIWLTQEADAKSWSGLKHVQPKEGRKELAPREIKFHHRGAEAAIRERAGSSQEGRKRAKDTPRAIFLCFFFLFIPNSRCSRQKSSRHGRDESRQESPMVQTERKAAPQSAKAFCATRDSNMGFAIEAKSQKAKQKRLI